MGDSVICNEMGQICLNEARRNGRARFTRAVWVHSLRKGVAGVMGEKADHVVARQFTILCGPCRTSLHSMSSST